MKKILVPTDFSPTAEKAFRVALDLAEKNNGTVVLYHVCTPIESTFVATEEKRRKYNLQMKRNAARRLQRLKKKIAVPGPVPVETVIGHSPLIDNILGFADREAIDLIVMGTQGASGLKKTIIGSEASRLAQESEIPVLLVPEKFVWKEPGKIVFATDYVQSESHALQLTIRLAQVYRAELTLVHLFTPNNADSSPDKEIAKFETYAEYLQKRYSQLPLRFKPIQTDAVRETLENLDQELPYDLLVMVRRNKMFLQKLFLKSFTKAMSYVTKQPLLVIPAGYQPAKMEENFATEKNEVKTPTS